MSFNGVSQVSSRDIRLLAGTAVAMLLTTATDSQCAGSAAWSLLQITNTGQLLHLIALKGIVHPKIKIQLTHSRHRKLVRTSSPCDISASTIIL